MRKQDVPVEIDGQMKKVVVGERSGASWLGSQELALKGAIVGVDGKPTNIKGETTVLVLKKQIEDAIKEYPEGIADFIELLNKITEREINDIAKAVKEINDTGELEKKSKGQ